MERVLAWIFMILALMCITFVFYLQVNALGVLYSYHRRSNEIDCHYFTGTALTKTTYHNARGFCPLWQDVF